MKHYIIPVKTNSFVVNGYTITDFTSPDEDEYHFIKGKIRSERCAVSYLWNEIIKLENGVFVAPVYKSIISPLNEKDDLILVRKKMLPNDYIVRYCILHLMDSMKNNIFVLTEDKMYKVEIIGAFDFILHEK